jgi:hypothetical protein
LLRLGHRGWATGLKYTFPGDDAGFTPTGAWVCMTHYGFGDVFCIPILLSQAGTRTPEK